MWVGKQEGLSMKSSEILIAVSFMKMKTFQKIY